MMYSQSVRAEVKKSSGAGSKDIASLIGEQWRNLSDAEKAKWTKAAKDSKESYVAEHGEVRFPGLRRAWAASSARTPARAPCDTSPCRAPKRPPPATPTPP
jgi:hypothetical protein